MNQETGLIIGICALGAILIVLFVRALIVGSIVVKSIGQMLDDTLKKDGKWSKMSIITASAWLVVMWAFIYDELHNGFNETAWFGLLAVASGNKVMDAWSKKVDPTITAPKDPPLQP